MVSKNDCFLLANEYLRKIMYPGPTQCVVLVVTLEYHAQDPISNVVFTEAHLSAVVNYASLHL